MVSSVNAYRLAPRFFVLIALLLVLPRLCAAQDALPPVEGDDPSRYLADRLTEHLGAMDWGSGRVAILVEDGEVPLKIFGRNESAFMEPSALMQIVTASAALTLLGPDFRFKTELGYSGQIEKHKLTGNILVRGNGDPSIPDLLIKDPDDSWTLFDRWIKLLRKQGIKEVQGLVIGDGRAFDSKWQAPGWPMDQLGSASLPSVSALNFNQNCVDFFWHKGRKAGKNAEFAIFPVLPKYIYVASSVRLADQPRAGRRYERVRDGNLISAFGELPLKTEAHDRAAVEDPARFFAEAFKARLGERGIEVKGAANSASALSPGEISEQLTIVDTQPSPPLSLILSQMMRYDLALNAEVLFKTMGLKKSGVLGSFQTGTDAVEDFLTNLHLPGASRVIIDGSGRSSLNRLTALQITQILRRMLRSGEGPVFESLFPRAWDDGSLADRFRPVNLDDGKDKKSKKKTPKPAPKEAPAIWAKAGSSPNAECLAGWVRSRTGQRLVFAFIVNGSKAPQDILRRQLDELALDLTR